MACSCAGRCGRFRPATALPDQVSVHCTFGERSHLLPHVAKLLQRSRTYLRSTESESASRASELVSALWPRVASANRPNETDRQFCPMIVRLYTAGRGTVWGGVRLRALMDRRGLVITRPVSRVVPMAVRITVERDRMVCPLVAEFPKPAGADRCPGPARLCRRFPRGCAHPSRRRV